LLIAIIKIGAAEAAADTGAAKADLEPQPLRIVTIENAPFVTIDKESNKFRGYLIDMLAELRKLQTFSYNLTLVKDGKFGFELSDGQWNGLVGELVRGEADMALAPLTITKKRQNVIDFSLPYMQTGISMLHRRPAQAERIPFRTVLELVAAPGIEYGSLSDGSTYAFFQNSKYRLYQEMGLAMEQKREKLPKTILDAINMVRTNRSFVFLGEKSMLEYHEAAPPCNLMIVGETLNQIGYGLGFSKTVPDSTRDYFNHAILELNEKGILKMLKDTHWNDQYACKKPKLCICPKKT